MTPAEAYNRLLFARETSALEQAGQLGGLFAARGIRFGGESMRSFLRPHLIGAEEWRRLRERGRRLLELCARVARQVFDGDAARLCEWLGVPPALSRWVVLDPGEPDVVLSRLDAFLTPEGPRFIEINSDAPAGFGYGDRMAEVFRELPLFAEFAARRSLRYFASGPALVARVLEAWRRSGRAPHAGEPVVAIVDFADVKTLADQEILREAFESSGVACRLADPRALQLSGGRLIAAGRAIDIVYRRGVLSELVEREDELGPFFEAYRRGDAVFVNSFRCHLSEDKAFFALLHDPSFEPWLSKQELGLVRASVPWTAKVEERRSVRDGVEVDLVPFVLSHREQLVLKPAHGYGGRSVFVGDETSPAEWESAVRAALGAAWIVQERVAIPEESFPVVSAGRLVLEALKVNVNPFYVAGAEVGAVTRASRSSVINVSAGGGSVPTFVVESEAS